MESAKPHNHKEKRVSYRRRKHKNKKFYNSKAWRETREAYIRHYDQLRYRDIPKYKWNGQSLKPNQVSYILSLSFTPCETCLRLFAAEAYDSVEEGKELDHIEPVNPDDALDRIPNVVVESKPGERIEGHIEYKYGDPYSFDNLQLLCKRHHAKKSQREKK